MEGGVWLIGGGVEEEDLEGNVEGKEMSSPSRTIDPDPKLAKLRGGLAGGGVETVRGHRDHHHEFTRRL